MKKNHSIWMLACTALLFTSIVSNAQYAKTGSGIITAKSVAAFSANIGTEETDKLAMEALKNKSSRAFKNFSRHFDKATDIKLSMLEKGFTITCSTGHAQNRVLYNKNGHWVNTIKSYSHTQLRPDVRALLEANYPRFEIYGTVLEVHVGNKMAHLVLIENQKAWKRIKVVEGEFEEYEAYNKPNEEN